MIPPQWLPVLLAGQGHTQRFLVLTMERGEVSRERESRSLKS